jgi:hypothetical protein
MIDTVISWAMHNPLQGVAVLAVVSIAVGLILVPSMHEISGHGPPKC